MRLQDGTLQKLQKITGISKSNLCDYIANRRYPSRKRAIELGEACKKLGLAVTKEKWMFGTSKEIKSALSKAKEVKSDLSTQNIK